MAGPRVLITPRAFLDLDGEHKTILKQAGYEIVANPRPRTLTEDEMAAYVPGMEALIVGDDPVTHRVLDRDIRGGKWSSVAGAELMGKMLGIVGMTGIGKEVAKRVLAMGMNVMAFDMHPDEVFAEYHGIEYVPADELLKNSDVVSLHLDFNPDTKGWLSKMRVARMRPGSYLINTGRPELIDEGSVLDALRSQRIRAAAFDLPTEDSPFTVPLLSQDNVP